MTASNHSMANRVADAILAALQEIGGSGWRTAPKKVMRGLAVDAQYLPKPALFLRCEGWGPNTAYGKPSGTSMASRAEAKFSVYCVCDQPPTNPEAEQSLNDLAADVIDAIMRDIQLGGVLASGFMKAEGYQPEVSLSGDGWSVAVVDLVATWLWDTSDS